MIVEREAEIIKELEKLKKQKNRKRNRNKKGRIILAINKTKIRLPILIKSLILHVYHALLDFYPCPSRFLKYFLSILTTDSNNITDKKV